MNSKHHNRSCEHCMRAMKNYISIGNRLIFKNVSGCMVLPSEHETGKPFEERGNCEHFVPDRIPAPRNRLEQRIAYVSRQLDEVTNLLCDILAILDPTADGDTAQKESKG